MHLLVFNLATDIRHPALGFATAWIARLATLADAIDVLTMYRGEAALPPNVRVISVGKERGLNEIQRGALFYCELHRILRSRNIDVCFSHMMPTFSVMGAPLLKLWRVPIVTWFAHPSLTWRLKASHFVSRVVVTSVEGAYPYRKDKVRVIGQGIDTDLFSPGGVPDSPPLILCVSRISKVKDQLTFIRALAILRNQSDLRFSARIIGSPLLPSDEEYKAILIREARNLQLDEILRFSPAVPREDLPDWYRRAAVHVNLVPRGFGDKVAWEAMSCGRPSVVANGSLSDDLGRHRDLLLFRYGDPHDLAARLLTLLRMDSGEITEIGLLLRERVVAAHGLDGLVNRLFSIFREVSYCSS